MKQTLVYGDCEALHKRTSLLGQPCEMFITVSLREYVLS